MKPVPSPYVDLMDREPGRPSQVPVLGGVTHLWEYGASDPARTLLLVHGFRGDHHGLEAVAAHLCADDPGLRVIVPDLPGFGESTPLTEVTHDIDGYSAWLGGLRHILAIDDTPVLGHSFGSIVVAAALAGGMPAPRAILVNPIAAPALSGPNGVGTRLAVFYYWLGAALPERLGFAVLRWGVVTRGMSITMAKTRDRGLRRWIHDQHDRYFGAFANRSVVLDAFRASVGHDVSEYASRIEQPVLLIGADRDDITPLAAVERLRDRFADADLEVLAGVGHLVHYERPAETAAFIRSFLSAGDGATDSTAGAGEGGA
jgi:pimeloyl-ACP methyl ester carboxylesterase